MISGPCGLVDFLRGASVFFAWCRRTFCRRCWTTSVLAANNRDRNRTSNRAAASAWETVPIAPAAVKTAIRQSLPVDDEPYARARVSSSNPSYRYLVLQSRYAS